MNKIKEFFEDTLNWLRDTSYHHSPERRVFAELRLSCHRKFMNHETKWSPYLHPEEWDKRG